MSNKKLNYKIINLAALVILLYFGFLSIKIGWDIIVKCISLLAPFIVGFVFAYSLTPLVRWLQKKGLNKAIALIIVIFGLIIIVFGLIAIVVPLLYDQIILLVKNVVEVFNNFNSNFNLNIGSFEIKLTDYLTDIAKEIGTFASSTTMGVLSSSINFSGKLIVGFVGFVYFLADMDKIRKGFKDILSSISNRLVSYIKCMDTEISNYLKGLEIFMVIQLFEYSILFLIIGHPNWLILGILACITTVIPYFGGLITNVIAIILATVVSPKLLILTIIICLIFPQLDGYLISPRVYGKTNNVNPLITIMVVSVGGTLKGMVGIIVALPIYLLIRTTYKFFKKDLVKGVKAVKETI